MNRLSRRDFLKETDFTPEDLTYLLELAARLKAAKKAGREPKLLKGRNIVILFEKDSTRTRCSFEVAAHDQGAHVTYLGPTGSQIGKKESMADTARVLSGFFDGIEYRGFGQEIVEKLAEYANVPVWNGLTNEWHPTQLLADMLTMQECTGRPLKGLTMAYLGDARYNMGNSLMTGCAMLGVNFRSVAPRALWTSDEVFAKAQEYAAESGAVIERTEDVAAGVKGCDFLYSDVWVSMGEPDEVWKERIELLTPYRVTAEVMDMTGNPECRFLHCLPAFHNRETTIGEQIYQKYGIDCMEVNDDVFESERNAAFLEAENRMHTIKAVMVATLAEKNIDRALLKKGF
ncbi:MAG: ornithine carbamoyltransferase [Desulfovibrionaceae bacterium]|nr:ornithine carbamoyltransferase [Desulfovibrionaceae bacterium]